MVSSVSTRSSDIPLSPRSTNDSLSLHPFAQPESLKKTEFSSRYGVRPDLTASSVTSFSDELDSSAVSRVFPITEVGENAISNLLQPPIVRTGHQPQTADQSAQRTPTTKDIPPVTLTNIPHVDSKAFLPYLSQAGALYDAFQRAKEGVDEGYVSHLTKTQTPSTTNPPKPSIFGPQRRPTSTAVSQNTSEVTGASLEFPRLRTRTSAGYPRRGPATITPISTVPNVYFEQDFRLENPRTFDIVSERSEIVRSQLSTDESLSASAATGRKTLATNAILQEKLSWYMDTVEVHLISSISAASTSFFAALGSLRELHLEASDSVAKIQALRKDLAKLDKDMAMGGLKVVAMRRRRENMRRLGDAVRQLDRVVQAMVRCEDKIDRGDIEDALQELADVERLINGDVNNRLFNQENTIFQSHDPRSEDLRSVKALQDVDNDIAFLRKRIGKGFETRFINALLGDLRHHVDTVSSRNTFQRWDKGSQRFRTDHNRIPSILPAYLQLDDSLRSSLRFHLEALRESESVMPATIAYREAVLREIKNLIRRHLPSSSDDDTESTMSASTQGGRQMTQQEKSTILARNLRELDAEDAEEKLKSMYSNVGEALRRLGTQVKVLLDITSSMENKSSGAVVRSPKSPPLAGMSDYMNGTSLGSNRQLTYKEDIQQALDMSHLLGQAVDIAQAQLTKILKVRSEQSVHLSLPQFLRYFHLNRLFADECEAVSGRGGMALKTIVNMQIKDFVAQFSESEKQRLIQGMDVDRWDAKDFTVSHNRMLDRVLEASTRDVDAWTKSCVIWNDEQPTASDSFSELNDELKNRNGLTQDKTHSATIDEQKYMLPDSALIVLCGIERFEHLIAGIPSITQDITSSLLEYLGLFNSRSQQLILGAGATKSAGLKNITTKHLALASQALSFVTALTPHVREFVRRHSLGASGLMTEFDKMKREYQEHQVGINEKLVEIMSGRTTAHVNAMKKVHWDTESTQSINGYMETLVKETATLHKVLGKYLPEMNVYMIMDPVFASYRQQWGQAFQEVDVRTLAGKQRMLRDVEFFKSRIGRLNGAAELSASLVKIVEDKSVRRAEAAPPTNAQDASNEEEPSLAAGKT